MNDLTLSISEPHDQALRDCLFPANGHEAGAFLICGVSDIGACPWSGRTGRRYVTRKVIPISSRDVVSSSPRHYEWRKAGFLQAYRAARDEGLAIAFVHSHRGIHAFFSDVDDENDRALAELVAHRQKPRPDLLSLVMDEENGVVGRRLADLEIREDIGRIVTYSRGWWRVATDSINVTDECAFDRQMLAFGPDFLAALREMRVTVVGAGATGSAVLALLMRLGARYIASIDPQTVELTNTTRIHGSSLSDATHGIAKVAVAERMVEQSGFAVEIKPFRRFVTDVEVRDVLKSSDVIFGCTDDHEGRMYLNRFAYFYNTPLIDMGISIDPTRVRDNFVRSVDGRITVVAPGLRCLVCRGVVNPAAARDEQLKRTDPETFGERLAEGYIATEFTAAPSVITITTAVACMAVDELTARLTSYRDSADHVLRKFVVRKDFSPGPKIATCGVCNPSHWGRGDVVPFLDRVS